MASAQLLDTAYRSASPPVAGPSPRATDDPTARGLLRRAQGAFQKWPEGFAGFRASVRCETRNGVASGTLSVATPDHVEVRCDDPGLCAWLADMLRAIARQRTPRFFDEGDGRFPISFADGAPDSRGRAIDVHARLGALRYWVDAKGRVTQVERRAQGLRVLTTFDELVRATPGRVLPARTMTSTWSLSSGELLRSEAVHDVHRRLDHVWLPASRRIGGPCGAPPIELILDDHELL